MRTMKALAFAAAATAMMPLAGMAQETTTTTSTTPPAQAEPAGPAVLTEQKSGEVLSDSYLGADVVARSAEGAESVGKVSDLLLGEDDKIIGVVVNVGGFLGVGSKPVGLSWAALTEEMSDGTLILRTSLTREDLEQAPEFKTLEAQQVESDREMIDQESAPASPTLQ
ncbi:MAG: PRC-barrel domain-containing protein [Kiloniellaceae bacterium]